MVVLGGAAVSYEQGRRVGVVVPSIDRMKKVASGGASRIVCGCVQKNVAGTSCMYVKCQSRRTCCSPPGFQACRHAPSGYLGGSVTSLDTKLDRDTAAHSQIKGYLAHKK